MHKSACSICSKKVLSCNVLKMKQIKQKKIHIYVRNVKCLAALRIWAPFDDPSLSQVVSEPAPLDLPRSFLATFLQQKKCHKVWVLEPKELLNRRKISSKIIVAIFWVISSSIARMIVVRCGGVFHKVSSSVQRSLELETPDSYMLFYFPRNLIRWNFTRSFFYKSSSDKLFPSSANKNNKMRSNIYITAPSVRQKHNIKKN